MEKGKLRLCANRSSSPPQTISFRMSGELRKDYFEVYSIVSFLFLSCHCVGDRPNCR